MEVISQAQTTGVPVTDADGSYHLMVTIKAPTLPHVEGDEQPISLVVLGDVSGSMDEASTMTDVIKRSLPGGGQYGSPVTKMDQERDTLKAVVKHLPVNGQLGIIAFDHGTKIVHPIAPIHHEERDQLCTKIDKEMRPDGMTDIYRALDVGKEELTKAPPNSTKALLLVTDGDPTAGIKDASAMINALGPVDFRIHCFGVGSNHKGENLKKIADHGAGNYNYIQNADDMKVALGACIGGLLGTYAEGLELRIKIANFEVKRIKTAFPVTQEGDFHIVKIPDIQEGESRDILIEINVPPSHQAPSVKQIGEFSLSYLAKSSGNKVTIGNNFYLSRTPANQPHEPNRAVYVQMNRFIMIDAMNRANQLANLGDLTGAKTCIDDAINRIKASPVADDMMSKAFVADLEACRKLFNNQSTYLKDGSNTLMSVSASHAYQRTSSSSNGNPSLYVTVSQMNTVNDYMTGSSASSSSTGSLHSVHI